MIQADWVKKEAIIIDVGINRLEENGQTKIVGDVDFHNLYDKALAITPVPAVWFMTIAFLM